MNTDPVPSSAPSMFDATFPESTAPKEASPIVEAVLKEAEAAKAQVIEDKIAELQSPDIPYFIEPKADLVWGASGTGKTVNIGEVSDYVLQKTGKLTRMVSADGGGIGPLTGLAKSGQLEFWALNAWKNPIANLERAIKGYWPLKLDDPESPLVPPDAGTFEVYGFGAFEGLTSFGDMILDNLSVNKASLSQDPSYTWTQDGIDFSGENMAYYGFMQKELQRKVALSHLLRYGKVLWTAQESKGEEKGGGMVYGPMIGGKKATGKAAGWFLNVFHMDVIPRGEVTIDPITKQKMQEVDHILFLKTHIDPLTLIPYPCKLRAPKAYVKEVKPYLQSGSVADAYRLLDAMYERQEKESSGKMEEIKGLKEKLLERAAAAKIKEQVEMEKRAKNAGLLRAQVSVPGGPVRVPSLPVTTPKVATPTVAATPVAVPAIPAIPGTPAKVSGPVKVPGIPTIQNVRR